MLCFSQDQRETAALVESDGDLHMRRSWHLLGGALWPGVAVTADVGQSMASATLTGCNCFSFLRVACQQDGLVTWGAHQAHLKFPPWTPPQAWPCLPVPSPRERQSMSSARKVSGPRLTGHGSTCAAFWSGRRKALLLLPDESFMEGLPWARPGLCHGHCRGEGQNEHVAVTQGNS